MSESINSKVFSLTFLTLKLQLPYPLGDYELDKRKTKQQIKKKFVFVLGNTFERVLMGFNYMVFLYFYILRNISESGDIWCFMVAILICILIRKINHLWRVSDLKKPRP